MLINVLPVASEFQPNQQNFRAPPHNADYGVEQDFLVWLQRNRQFVSNSPDEADWDYLPIFWNRYYINNQWGQAGLDELKREIETVVTGDRTCFTVCEYDLRAMQPFLGLDKLHILTASRQGVSRDIDIPLLCSPHPIPARLPDKSSKAFFAGNARTFGVRIEMAEALNGCIGVDIDREGQQPPGEYTERMLRSCLALAPRGHGGSSFRFYEAMQLGVVPLHIGVPDVRPFQSLIDWDSCSLYRKDNEGLADYIYGLDSDTLIQMGKTAKWVFDNYIGYQRWEDNALYELPQKLADTE